MQSGKQMHDSLEHDALISWLAAELFRFFFGQEDCKK